MSDLTSVSSQLAADRGNLAKALDALARAVGTVRTFVRDNKDMVETDVERLTRLTGVLARHQKDLNTLARIGALGLDNLTVGFDNKTNTQGARLQATPNGANLGNMICDIMHNSGRFPRKPDGSNNDACELLRTIVAPFSEQIGADPSQNQSQPAQLKLGGTDPTQGPRWTPGRPEGGERIMSRSLRQLRRRSVAATVLLLVAALLMTGCKFDGAYDLPLPGDKVDEDDGFYVTAEFADALNVVPRTAVFANDVPVGQVSEVERSGWHAKVKFLVRKDIKLPQNIEIDVRQTSLLGEKYLALVEPAPGTASDKRLSDGDFIPLSRTSRNPEVEEVLGALSALLAGGGVASAEDDQPRAERDDERPPGPGPAPAGQPEPDGRRPQRAEGRHHRRDGVHRPALLDPGQGEGRHRRGHRQHGPCPEGAEPTAPGPDEDAAPAGQAGRGRHAGAQQERGQHRRLACATCSPP